MKRIFLLFAIIFVLIGCNAAYKEYVAEAESALESGEFEHALELYTFALEEKSDSSEVQAKIALLTDYETLKEKITNIEWLEAFNLANGILKSDEIVPSLQKEVKELLTTIEDEKEKEEQIASELKKIEKLIHSDNIEKANSQLIELDSEINSDALKSEVDDLHTKLEAAEKRVAEKEQKEREKEAKKQAAAANNLQQKYLQKADELRDRIISEAREIGLNEQDMQPGFYGQYYTEWDNLLNEVWGVLKDTMPNNEFERLKLEQREWIKMKEQTFENMPDESASSRAAATDYQATETTERTYYLIREYMN